MAPGDERYLWIEILWDALSRRTPIDDHFPRAVPSATMVQAVGLKLSERVASTTVWRRSLRRQTGAESAYHHGRGQRPRLPMKRKTP